MIKYNKAITILSEGPIHYIYLWFLNVLEQK